MKNDKKRYDNGWETFEERVILETPIANIKSGPVKSGRNGRKKDFFYFDFPDWVNVIALTPEKKLVMIRQFRYGSKREELEIPGGMIDPGEDPVTAGCRELLEETGYAGSDAEIIGRVCPNPAIQGNSCYTVLVREAELKGEQRFDDMEDIEHFLMSENEVFKRIDSGSLNHGLVLNGLLFYRLWSGK